MKNFKIEIKTHLDSAFIELETEPEGMADYKNKLKRHPVYNSVFIDVSFDLKFVKDGYTRMKAAYDDKGHTATCEILIDEYNSSTNSYNNIFGGVADFSEYRETEIYASVKWESSQKLQLFRSRENNKYQLTSTTSTDGTTVPDITDIERDVTLPEFDFEKDAEIRQFAETTVYSFFPADSSTSEGTTETAVFEDVEIITNNIGESVAQGTVIFTSPLDGTISMDGTLPLRFSVNALTTMNGTTNLRSLRANVKVTRTYDTFVEYSHLFQEYATDPATTQILIAEELLIDLSTTGVAISSSDVLEYEVEITVIVDKEVGDHFEVYTQFAKFGDASDKTRIDTLYFNFLQAQIDAFDAKGIGIHDAFARQLQLMTSETNIANLLDSELLGITTGSFPYSSYGQWSGLMVTSGSGIINHNDINTSFRDLFKSLDAIEPVGLWYNKTSDIFEIKKYAEYFANTNIATLSNVSDLTKSVDKDRLFSSISGGYDNSEGSDYVNGGDEYNTNFEMSTTLKNVSKKLDVKSKLRADTIGINSKRLLYETNELNTESDIDTKGYLIHSKNGFTTAWDGSDLTQCEGLAKPENWFNILITPHRNMMRQVIGRVNTMFPNLVNSYLRYVSSKSKNNIKTQYVGDLIGDFYMYERDFINCATVLVANTPYLPEIYEFEAKVSLAQRQAIKANPHGYITFTFNGTTYRGFILEADLNNNNNKGVFKLLKKV